MALQRFNGTQRKLLRKLLEADRKADELDKEIDAAQVAMSTLSKRLRTLRQQRAEMDTEVQKDVPKLRSLYPEALFPGDEDYPRERGRGGGD